MILAQYMLPRAQDAKRRVRSATRAGLGVASLMILWTSESANLRSAEGWREAFVEAHARMRGPKILITRIPRAFRRPHSSSQSAGQNASLAAMVTSLPRSEIGIIPYGFNSEDFMGQVFHTGYARAQARAELGSRAGPDSSLRRPEIGARPGSYALWNPST